MGPAALHHDKTRNPNKKKIQTYQKRTDFDRICPNCDLSAPP